MVCGYVQPPKEFQDPDLELSQKLDLRRDDADPNGMDVSDVAGVEDSINDLDRDGLDDESGQPMDGLDATEDSDLVCPVCGTGFSSHPTSVSMEDPMAGSLDQPDEEGPQSPAAGLNDPNGDEDLPEGQDLPSEQDNAAEGDVCPACGKGVLAPPGEAQAEMGEDPEEAGELGAPGDNPFAEGDPEDETVDGEEDDDPDAQSESPFGETDPEDEQPESGDERDEEDEESSEDEDSDQPPFSSDDDEEDDEDQKPAGRTPWHR